MLRRAINWTRDWTRKHWRGLVVLAAVLLVGVNGIAFMHARSMTHFAPPSNATIVRPGSMTLGQKIGVAFTGMRIPRPTNRARPDDFGMAFTTHRFVTEDGANLEAWHIAATTQPTVIDGRRRSHRLVLMFHGYMVSKSVMLGEAKAFHEIGCDCLLVDFRGSGGSSGNDTTIGYRESLDVAAALQYAERTFPPAALVLYGESMGSAAILRAIAINGVEPAEI